METTDIRFKRINGTGSSIFWAEGTRWGTVRDPQENEWAIVEFPTNAKPHDHNIGENHAWFPFRDQAQREIARRIERERG
jgi:hypothetical protein